MKYRKLDSSVFADNSKYRFFSRLKDGHGNYFLVFNPGNSKYRKILQNLMQDVSLTQNYLKWNFMK